MPEPYANAFFCDDVRAEVGGKMSYMGVYNDDLIFKGPPPGTLARLFVIVKLWIPFECDFKTVTIRLLSRPADKPDSGGGEIANISADTLRHPANGSAGSVTTLTYQMELGQFIAKVPSNLSVQVSVDERLMEAGRLRVKFSTPQE